MSLANRIFYGAGKPTFTFVNEAEDKAFSCKLQAVRCVGKRKDGQRCTRNTIKSLDRCWQHLKSELGLVIKPSNILGAGNGLFTIRYIPKDKNICRYLGEKLTKQQLDQRYGIHATAPYALEWKRGYVIDSACERGVGSWINAIKQRTKANCKFSLFQGQVNIKATKNIQKNSELTLHYGRDYNFDEDGVWFKTKPYDA